MFSTLQNINFRKQDSEEVKAQIKEAIEHLSFATSMCLRQATGGRRYLLEHPAGATSFQTAILNKVFFVEGGVRVNFDFCMAGMVSSRGGEGEKVKKRTGVMTNSPEVVSELKKLQCDNTHSHTWLIDGKAKECERYADLFCEIICKAAMTDKNEKASAK